jgi:hypothetical protein
MCMAFEAIKTLIIWAIVIGAAFLILQAVLSFILPKITVPMVGEIIRLLIYCIKIVIYAIVCIVVVVICFDLIACLLSYAPSLRLH